MIMSYNPTKRELFFLLYYFDNGMTTEIEKRQLGENQCYPVRMNISFRNCCFCWLMGAIVQTI